MPKSPGLRRSYRYENERVGGTNTPDPLSLEKRVRIDTIFRGLEMPVAAGKRLDGGELGPILLLGAPGIAYDIFIRSKESGRLRRVVNLAIDAGDKADEFGVRQVAA